MASKKLVSLLMYFFSVLIWLVLLNKIFGVVSLPDFLLPLGIIIGVILFIIKAMMVRKEMNE
ncbi:hypothetical protein KIH41_11355 [Litoribacter ruber]|uniref:hypothetical protein n=1 Tax=Litoribacter ruber TaxID=702568 RepID=UPI001BDAE25E|nr:hypothetical protein [Litoribacter ruber]MBT0811874.1 hypothetical protein [Litoribacter ruber]